MGKETQARPTDGQLARSGGRPRTASAVRASGLEPADARARGGAERGWPRAGPRAPARPSEVFGPHSPPGVGSQKKGPGPSPRAWHFSGHRALPRCRLRSRGGARGAGCRARESAAAASNPALSSLRLRHARSAEGSRALRAAVAARRSPRGRGCAQGERWPESWGPGREWGDFERKDRSAPRGFSGCPGNLT